VALSRASVDPAAPDSSLLTRAAAVARCAALGPVCIYAMATSSAWTTGEAVVDGGVAARDAAIAGAEQAGENLTDLVVASATPVAEVSSAVRWATVGLVSIVFLVLAFLVTWVLLRTGIL
jgi:hypothetical protein